jgi:Holliday junction resolvase RusA-like endonuclease
MLHLHWTGRAVSDNDRHRLGRGRIVATAEYRAFRDGLALIFRSQAQGKRLARPDVRMQVALPAGSRIDRNNLIKATCDALELAGIIANDRELNHSHFHIEPVTAAAGADAEITLLLSSREEMNNENKV